MGNSYVTQYNYRNGYFETDSREFRGFGWVKVTQIEASGQESSYKETYFYQDDTRKGRPRKELVYDKYNRLYSETNYTWHYGGTDTSPTYRMVWGGLVPFPTLEEKETIVYNPQDVSEVKSTRITYDYDEYGNVLELKEYGFDDTVLKRTDFTYTTPNLSCWIIGKPADSIIYEGDGATKVAETRYYYDNQGLGAEPTQGSLTKEERWLNLPSEKYISTQYSYDTYGNIITVTDALGRVTTTTYEATKTFPESVENALGHTQQFTYKYETGKILTTTDPNGKTTTSTYDGFGRPTRVEGPEALSYVEYQYSPKEARPQWVKTTTKVGGGLPDQISYNYADGLGRTIETTVIVDNGQQIASNIVEYDSKGQIVKKYLPYYEPEGQAPAWGSPPTPSSPFTQYFYDPMGRVTKSVRPDGKVSQNIYGMTTTENINEKGQRNKITKDEYGRITDVEEANGKVMHYDYDILGNLTKVSDCLGNEFIMRYDSLGRKIGTDDPDMGSGWEYVYDDVGNLLSQIDAKGQTLEFQYDDINRLTSKSTGVTYIYNDNLKGGDTPLNNGVGRLDRVTYPGGEASFEYDALGREKISRKIVDGHEYTITRDYDALDRLTKVIYPDGTAVTYKYNRQGGIDLVGEGTDEDYFVQETRYDQYGHLRYVKYGNNSATTYTYDDYTLRLTHITTTDANGTTIQDLDYSFDNIGNIKTILDSIHESNTQYFNYDDINRLTSASSGAGGYNTITYNYDDIGNITHKGDLLFNYEKTGNAGPHAVTSTTGSKAYTFSYDQNGNMLAKGNTSYQWDIENRVTQVAVEKGGEAIELNLSLQAGWNLISLPFRTVDTGEPFPVKIEEIPISQLLQSINGKYEQVSRYDESIDDPNTGHWQHYVGNSKFDQFTEFQYGEGYLIYIKDDVTSCNLTLTGYTAVSEQTRQLFTGWNLIGAITDDIIKVQDLFPGLGITTAKSYNGSSYDDVTTLEKGKSYFINLATDQTWTIPVGSKVTQYEYDGEGSRTKRITDTKTNTYVGSVYELEKQ